MNQVPHIVYEDNHYIAINKPAGYAVQPEENDNDTIIPWLQSYIGKRDKKPGLAFIGVIHRLDKPVTGVLLLAKTSKGQERANELWKSKKIRKIYFAVVPKSSIPSSGTLTHYFSRKDDEFKMSVSNTRRSQADQEAILQYQVVSIIDHYMLLAIELITGRRHQIRAQLNAIGCPIIGDKRYGSKESVEGDFIYLHCGYLAFDHPVKHEAIKLKATPDFTKQFWRMFKSQILEWKFGRKDEARL